ncbi:MAG: hypothetical protein APF82_04685 [Sphingomonadales bacterium BRH_c42]|nr:MAG: hypothetical protein APF82_04685 [Sphingomonadales bacterium BRH_c42]
MGRAVYIAAALLTALAALIVSLGPAPMRQGSPAACVIKNDTPIAPELLPEGGAHWTCRDAADSNPAHQHGFARFDLASDGARPPRYMVSRIGPFDRLVLTVADRDGAVRSRSYGPDQARLISGAPLFQLELPEVTPRSHAVFMQIEGMRHDMTLTHAALFAESPGHTIGHYREMMFLSLLLGMMLAPVLFDMSAWSALRLPFIRWHASLVIAFSMLVFVQSGLVTEFVDLTMAEMRVLLIMALGIAAFTACMFTHNFIEDDRMDRRLRRMLPWAGAWALAASAIHSLNFDFVAPLGAAFHSYAMAPVLLVMMLAMLDAYRKGSRAIRFQIIGWIPLFAAFTTQLLSYLTPMDLPTDALAMLYLGVMSETAITALGVADRFYILRRERDIALSQAHALGELTERDPLTGLLNRRAIDSRFEELHAEGYETFALFDLDHFKHVNDTAGHAMGDRVLQIVARVLDEDPGSIAIRMGGEEFLLLMRGDDAEQRLERLRAQIPIRVAHEVPQLESLVTASVGMVIAPQRAVPRAGFALLYNHADRLLYDAKSRGRNRIACEKLCGFERRKGDRRCQERQGAAA